MLNVAGIFLWEGFNSWKLQSKTSLKKKYYRGYRAYSYHNPVDQFTCPTNEILPKSNEEKTMLCRILVWFLKVLGKKKIPKYILRSERLLVKPILFIDCN